MELFYFCQSHALYGKRLAVLVIPFIETYCLPLGLALSLVLLLFSRGSTGAWASLDGPRSRTGGPATVQWQDSELLQAIHLHNYCMPYTITVICQCTRIA
ncbi:hypothetical protein B0T19DRAFT_264046 [Cercophora scortea]|uniref:Uncharacterized protein n=1 Tax=Cercophora scortea TaxID=314031 RepID=A0AAE0M7E9_9PEZI|nr:hypothetical protein B0T19DRAFT_264046 [Cercophora scortea]